MGELDARSTLRAETRVRRPRFVVRTIRNGRVRILGHEWEPRGESAERFNGMRAAFGLYWGPPNFERYDDRGLMSSCALWGSEKAFLSDAPGVDWPGPFCEDGTFKWEWWKRVGSGV